MRVVRANAATDTWHVDAPYTHVIINNWMFKDYLSFHILDHLIQMRAIVPGTLVVLSRALTLARVMSTPEGLPALERLSLTQRHIADVRFVLTDWYCVSWSPPRIALAAYTMGDGSEPLNNTVLHERRQEYGNLLARDDVNNKLSNPE